MAPGKLLLTMPSEPWRSWWPDRESAMDLSPANNFFSGDRAFRLLMWVNSYGRHSSLVIRHFITPSSQSTANNVVFALGKVNFSDYVCVLHKHKHQWKFKTM